MATCGNAAATTTSFTMCSMSSFLALQSMEAAGRIMSCMLSQPSHAKHCSPRRLTGDEKLLQSSMLGSSLFSVGIAHAR